MLVYDDFGSQWDEMNAAIDEIMDILYSPSCSISQLHVTLIISKYISNWPLICIHLFCSTDTTNTVFLYISVFKIFSQ